MLALVALLVDVFVRAAPWLDVQFLTGSPSSRPERAGILPALVGTIEIGIIVGLITFPIGVARGRSTSPSTRRTTRLNRLLQTNISNLAGVPSIIYGILGLALFVRTLALGPTVLAAALTLSLADPAGRDHRVARGPEGGSERAARGRLRPRRDPLADGPPVGPAGCGARDHDRDHPGDGQGDRRGGAAHPHRRLHVRDLPARIRSPGSTPSCRSRSSTGRCGRRTTSRASRPRRSS